MKSAKAARSKQPLAAGAAQPFAAGAAQPFAARTRTQSALVRLLECGPPIVVTIGPAGTGKTAAAAAVGVRKLLAGEVSKIVVARPAVTTGEEHGFLPGGLADKMAPWCRPVTDALAKYLSPAQVARMIADDVVELCPLAYCRGRTFERAWMMLEEGQLATPSQLLMYLSRIGEGSRLIVTGDEAQSDLGPDNGLTDLLARLGTAEGAALLDGGIAVVRFGDGDVVRHPVIPRVLSLYSAARPPP